MNYLPRSPQIAVYLQLRQLLQGLNTKKSTKINQEVQMILGQLGVPGEQFFFTVLLEGFEIQKERLNPTYKHTFLNQWLLNASTKSHFIDYFGSVLEIVSTQSSVNEYFNDLIQCLKTPLSVQILISVSLINSPNPKTQHEGVKLLRKKMHEYFQLGKPQLFPSYSIHPLLYIINTHPELSECESEVTYLLDSLGDSARQPELKTMHSWVDTIGNDQLQLPKLRDLVSAVDILKDVGPSCCSEKTNMLNVVLKDLLPLSEEDIMCCLIYMANHIQSLEDRQQREVNDLFYASSKPISEWEAVLQQVQDDKPDKKIQCTWNIDTFIEFCGESNRQLKWDQVILRLDRPNLDLLEQKTWNNLMNSLGKVKKAAQFQFPSRIILEKWNNKTSQMQFLGHMLRVGRPEFVFWNEVQTKKNVIVEFNPNYRSQLSHPSLQFWCNLDLLQLLVEMSDEGFNSEIRELFDLPIKLNPDLIMLGLAQLQPQKGGPLIDELFTSLFPNYVTQHANTVQVLEALWKHNKNLVIAGISELYRKELGKKDNSCLNLSRVLDITQSISQCAQQTQSLLAMAHSGDHNFSVPLGVLAGKREFLNFDRWIQDRIKAAGVPFANTLLSYIDENVLLPVREQQQKMGLQAGQLGQMGMPILDVILEKAQMKLEMMTITFEQLLSRSELGQKIRQRAQHLYKELTMVFPQLAGPPNPRATQEVERLTDQWFNQFYSETITCEQLLGLMQQWKSLGSLQEKEVCSCIVTNLFNEYQFHYKYPQKELQLTGSLFGGIIERGIVDGKALGVGLQIINVSLHQPNIRYEFGLRALEQLKSKAAEHQSFTEQLFTSEQLIERNYELLNEILQICEKKGVYLNISPERMLQLKQKLNKPQVPEPNVQEIVQPLQPQPIRVKPIVQQIPLNQSVTPPPQHTQIVIQQQTHTPQPVSRQLLKPEPATNSIVQQSFKEVLQVLFDPADHEYTEENVKSKITFIFNQITPDNLEDKCQELKTLIDRIPTHKWFCKYFALVRVPKTTYTQLVLHIYYQLVERINKRNLFKDLTREISQTLTILLELNKPNLSTDDRNTLKNMGSFLGQLTLNRSKAILTRHFNYRKLLSTTTHAIFVICKICEWALKSKVFKPQNVWLNSVLLALEKVSQQQQCISNLKYEIQLLFRTLEYNNEKDQAQNDSFNSAQVVEMIEAPAMTFTRMPIVQTPQPQNTLTIKNLPQYVQVDEKNLEYQMKHINLHQLIATAMDKAISDIIPPVITRSVTIALITTRELALKDFSLEPDEKKLLRGTHLIVQNLSGSLALVTCREPLKVSIQNHLRNLLKDINTIDNAQKEQIVAIASVDNLDLGCALIKKAVIEKSLEDVNQDRTIIEELEKRKTFRDQGISFYDEQVMAQFQMLPESLQPRIGGLREEEFRIYEEFGSQQRKGQNVVAPRAQLNPEKKMQLFIQKADHIIQSLFQLQFYQDNSLIEIVDELSKSPEIFEQVVAQELGERILEQALFTPLNQDRFANIMVTLETLIQRIIGVTQIRWVNFVHQMIEKNIQKVETQPLWYVSVVYFFKKQLITLGELEGLFVDLIEHYSQSAAKIGVVQALRQLFIQEQLVSIYQCKPLLMSLKNLNDKQPNTTINRFFADIQQHAQQQQLQQQARQSDIKATKVQQVVQPQIQTQKQKYLQLSSEVDPVFYELTQSLLREWADKTTQNQIVDFICTLESTVLLKNDENLQKFFVYSVDISCQQATSNSEKQFQQIDSLDYSMVDQMSKLIIFFLRGVVNFDRNLLFQKILDAVLIVITRYHETMRQSFNQRPLYKLLFNLIWEIRYPKYEFKEQEVVSLFTTFTHFLEKCNPSLYPGFSYAWLELLSNRFLLQIMLKDENGQKRQKQLIVKLLEFLRETITNETLMQESVNVFYQGVLRLFLVIIQCFQTFAHQNAIFFADEIPSHLIQLKNIFLAAYPEDQNYPKPEDVASVFQLFRLQKVYDVLEQKQMPEISHPCLDDQMYQLRMQEEIFGCFHINSDEELQVRIHNLFEIDDNTKVPPNISAFFILLPIIIYQRKSLHSFTDHDAIILIQRILRLASLELRHIIINVIVNHLRYPNKITVLYMNLFFTIFSEKDVGSLIEHISTILIQRITVERPQSWGLKFLHNELMRDAKYVQYQKHFQITGQQATAHE